MSDDLGTMIESQRMRQTNESTATWLADQAVTWGLRIGGPLAGGAIGTFTPAGPLGGAAIGGGLGEAAAETYEMARGKREEFSPGAITLNTALGGIPAWRGATITDDIGRGILQGGGEGLAFEVGQKAIDEQRLPTLGEAATGIGFGGMFGGGFRGAIHGYQAAKPYVGPAAKGAWDKIRLPFEGPENPSIGMRKNLDRRGMIDFGEGPSGRAMRPSDFPADTKPEARRSALQEKIDFELREGDDPFTPVSSKPFKEEGNALELIYGKTSRKQFKNRRELQNELRKHDNLESFAATVGIPEDQIVPFMRTYKESMLEWAKRKDTDNAVQRYMTEQQAKAADPEQVMKAQQEANENAKMQFEDLLSKAKDENELYQMLRDKKTGIGAFGVRQAAIAYGAAEGNSNQVKHWMKKALDHSGLKVGGGEEGSIPEGHLQHFVMGDNPDIPPAKIPYEEPDFPQDQLRSDWDEMVEAAFTPRKPAIPEQPIAPEVVPPVQPFRPSGSEPVRPRPQRGGFRPGESGPIGPPPVRSVTPEPPPSKPQGPEGPPFGIKPLSQETPTVRTGEKIAAEIETLREKVYGKRGIYGTKGKKRVKSEEQKLVSELNKIEVGKKEADLEGPPFGINPPEVKRQIADPPFAEPAKPTEPAKPQRRYDLPADIATKPYSMDIDAGRLNEPPPPRTTEYSNDKGLWGNIQRFLGKHSIYGDLKSRGTKAGDQIADAARTSEVEANRLWGEWSTRPDGFNDTAKKVIQNPVAMEQLAKTTNVWNGKTLQFAKLSVVERALEGDPNWRAEVSDPDAIKFIELAREATFDVGRMAHEVGLLMRHKDGLVPFTLAERGRMPRQFTEDFLDRSQRWVAGSQDLKDFARGVKETNALFGKKIDNDPTLSEESILHYFSTSDRKSALEIARQYPYMPSHYRSGGQWVQILDYNPLPHISGTNAGGIGNTLKNQIQSVMKSKMLGQQFDALEFDTFEQKLKRGQFPGYDPAKTPRDKIDPLIASAVQEIQVREKHGSPIQQAKRSMFSKQLDNIEKKLASYNSDPPAKLVKKHVDMLTKIDKLDAAVSRRLSAKIAQIEGMSQRVVLAMNHRHTGGGESTSYMGDSAPSKWLRSDAIGAQLLRTVNNTLSMAHTSMMFLPQPFQPFQHLVRVAGVKNTVMGTVDHYNIIAKSIIKKVFNTDPDYWANNKRETERLIGTSYLADDMLPAISEDTRQLETTLKRWTTKGSRAALFGLLNKWTIQSNDGHAVRIAKRTAASHSAMAADGKITPGILKQLADVGVTQKSLDVLKQGKQLTDDQYKALVSDLAQSFVQQTQFTHRSSLMKTRAENDTLLTGFLFKYYTYPRQTMARTAQSLDNIFNPHSKFTREEKIAESAKLLFGAAFAGVGAYAIRQYVKEATKQQDFTPDAEIFPGLWATVLQAQMIGPFGVSLDVLNQTYLTRIKKFSKDGKPYYSYGKSAAGSFVGTMPLVSAGLSAVEATRDLGDEGSSLAGDTLRHFPAGKAAYSMFGGGKKKPKARQSKQREFAVFSRLK